MFANYKKNNFLIAAICFLLLLIITIRLLIFIFWQFPSADGDEIMFLSISRFQCNEGIFGNTTNLIDINNFGISKYVWHGFLQPMLISFLNYDCSNKGNYYALTIIIIATFLLAYFKPNSKKNKLLSFFFAFACLSLQTKGTFRPELLCILLVILSENLISKRSYFFIIPITALAWTSPVSLIFYCLFVLIYHSDKIYIIFFSKIYRIFFIFLIINIIFIYLYPFKIIDLFHGLIAHQQKISIEKNEMFQHVTLWSLYKTVFFKNNFFPAFGLLFFISYIYLVQRKKMLLFLIVFLFFFYLKDPLLQYNIFSLFVAITYQIYKSPISFSVLNNQYKNVKKKKFSTFLLNLNYQFIIITLITFSAFIGLTQGLIRDINSKIKYNATFESAIKIFKKIELEEKNICEVPPYFALELEYHKFQLSKITTLAKCEKNKKNIVNIYKMHKYTTIFYKAPFLNIAECYKSHEEKELFIKYNNQLFNSDSGYAFVVCKNKI